MTDTNLTSLCVSDRVIASLDDLQFTLGEGPSLEAYASGFPVVEGQLTMAILDRWPILASVSPDAGIGGVFAFPLRIGAARLGVLALYQQMPNDFSPSQHADALIAADVLTHVILSVQANAPDGRDAFAFRDAGAFRVEIHQASGMLSEQVRVSVGDALVQLRSRAYATSRPIAEIAASVVAGRIRMYRSSEEQIEWSEES